MSNDDEMKDLIGRAYKIVSELDMPVEFQRIAFEALLSVRLRSRHGQRTQEVATDTSRHMPLNAGTLDSPTNLHGVGRIAIRLGVEEEEAKSLYRAQDDDVTIVASARRFSSQVAAATREVALLVAGGRQAIRLEEWTPSSHIREECKRLGKFDPDNFAATLGRLDEEFAFSGAGPKREVRLTARGWKSWEALARQLLSDE